MEYLLLSIILLLLIISPTFLRYIIKRIVLSCKLKKFCKTHNYSIIAAHKLWMFGFQNNNHNDFYIETPNDIYSVKLFGVLRRKYILIFTDSNEYLFRRAPAIRQMASPTDGPVHQLPNFDFHHNYQNEWNEKVTHPVLLVNPVGVEVRSKSNRGVEEIISAGEMLNGMEIYSLASFTEHLQGIL